MKTAFWRSAIEIKKKLKCQSIAAAEGTAGGWPTLSSEVGEGWDIADVTDILPLLHYRVRYAEAAEAIPTRIDLL